MIYLNKIVLYLYAVVYIVIVLCISISQEKKIQIMREKIRKSTIKKNKCWR